MILRKPYAMLIKYFKLLHFVMSFFMLLLLFRTFTLYNFFNAYVSDYSLALSEYDTSSVLNIYSFLIGIVILIVTVILLSVMIYKGKPKKLYIYNIVLYIAVLVLYGFCNSSLEGIHNLILDVRVSKALRDFLLIAILLQVAGFCLTIVRATGFDLKNFDFASDLHKLDISEKDSEEIEVSLEYDKNKSLRNFRKNLRNFKYVYIENRFVINTVLIILVIIISFILYFTRGVYSAYYNEGEAFDASSITLNVRSSFITQKNVSGDKITNNALVVLKVDLKSYSGSILNTGLATLHIGHSSFSQSTNAAKLVSDLGEPYTGEELGEEFTSYILAYEIPLSLIDKDMEFVFNDDVSYVKGEMGAKNNYVKLKPINLTENGNSLSFTMPQALEFDDNILGSTIFEIDSYEINDKFRYDYKYCASKSMCIDSYEYITATATGAYDKTLLRIKGDYILDDSASSDISDFTSFMNNFAYITYVTDKSYTRKITTTSVHASMGTEEGIYYVEVPKDVASASSIYFTFNVRNNSYKYILK